jgi:cysteinyl-tRNA synthetase
MRSETASIQIYNSLTRRKEPFETIRPGRVGMYLCGPTVYKEAHIGHMVGPVIFDCIKRYLTYCGYDVNWVVNITDVDDKLIAQSQARSIPMAQVATEMTMDYCANLLAMGVDQISCMPRATDFIPAIIVFIEDLIRSGYAYAANGDVFFDVTRDADYGKLSNRSADQQQGEGGEAAGKKRSPADFALWKKAKPDEPSWDSPWGKGRPGWHIECSAMSRSILGETFDIHGGGLDLIFPHHENEIAQSECCHGKPMARYWMHNGLLRSGEAAGKVGGRGEREAAAPAHESVVEAATKKMSRSAGAGGLRGLLLRQGGERVRFFLLRSHYRSTIVFSEEAVAEAGTALQKFYVFFERYQRITGRSFYLDWDSSAESRYLIHRRDDGALDAARHPILGEIAAARDHFLSMMDDDFNTGGAMSDLFQILGILNRCVDQFQLEDVNHRPPEAMAAFLRGTESLRELAGILGLFQKAQTAPSDSGTEEVADDLMKLLIGIRNHARENKDFATADLIRNELTRLGISLEDRKGGTGWRREK